MLTLNLASEIFLYPNSRPSGRLVVIEHNLDVIRCGDWVIDLGPEGGDKGGEIVVAGTPEEVEVVWLSWTAPIVNLCGGAPPLKRGSHR